ncbi:1,4-alpha-glucan (glycogen) branching enzyme, GH-13-type [Minicystis rosea]|nr:1,4-alpha-glucan (glycogen) branching enzyme, GH-13-type [Minicystis rosea]
MSLRRLDLWLFTLALVVAVAVIGIPLAAVRYPPMTDLPFHAAMTSTLRHYGDVGFHFREQFEWTPVAVPYVSLYALGAAFMWVLPPVIAVKCAVAVFLALLPAGLSILCRGLTKSPLLGVLGLLVVWGPLTHWGFINFVGAIGLFAASLGLALLVVERPTLARQAWLSLTLVILFFTHIFRFPIAVVAVVGAALIVGPRRRLAAVIASLLPSLALFAVWLGRRPPSLAAPIGRIALHLDRLSELDCLTGAFDDPREGRALVTAGVALAAFLVLGIVARVAGAERGARSLAQRGFRARARIVALGAVAGTLILYLVLPMQIGDWWYVYPREATTAVFLAFALAPDLPRAPGFRVAVALCMLVAPIPTALVVTRNYAEFADEAQDFAAITTLLPRAPRLLYLVFDHDGSTRRVSPFTHLPAWVQAEKGGWLSFHFTKFGAAPIRYWDRRGREGVIPPPTPPAWEWHPDAFDVQDRGPFFDWFLVRKEDSPAAMFSADSTIIPVAQVRKWWLYQRREPRLRTANVGDAPGRLP